MVMLALIGLCVLYLVCSWAMYYVPGWLLWTLLVAAYVGVFASPFVGSLRDMWRHRHAQR